MKQTESSSGQWFMIHPFNVFHFCAPESKKVSDALLLRLNAQEILRSPAAAEIRL